MQVSDGVKSLLRDDLLYTVLLFVLCVVAAFGLGRLAERAAGTPATVSTPAATAAVVVHEPPLTTEVAQVVVASKNGTKYHLPWCAGAQQMKAENKIEFASRADAEAAGYTPAANCKGL